MVALAALVVSEVNLSGFSPIIEELIQALRCLPSVGPKSAQRMALHLLDHDRERATHLADVLKQAIQSVKHCKLCRILCETDECGICHNPRRDLTKLCVVEGPVDVFALEQTASYRGRYFVLLGHLSPIDGIGPKELGMDLLEQHMQQDHLSEIILATNPTVEGEATAHYILQMAQKYQIKTSRIAHGVPLGGELEYLDSNTLALAFNTRTEFANE